MRVKNFCDILNRGVDISGGAKCQRILTRGVPAIKNDDLCILKKIFDVR